VAVLAGELLREGEKLIQMKIHPQHIIKGWRIAKDVAKETLQALARDNSQDMIKFKEDLLNIARTTLSSKLLQQDKVVYKVFDHFLMIVFKGTFLPIGSGCSS